MEGYFGPPVCAENIYIFFFMAKGSPPSGRTADQRAYGGYSRGYLLFYPYFAVSLAPTIGVTLPTVSICAR